MKVTPKTYIDHNFHEHQQSEYSGSEAYNNTSQVLSRPSGLASKKVNY